MDSNFVQKDGHVTQYQNLANSKWQTVATLKNRFLATSERFIVQLTENLVRRSRITFRHRPRDHNTNFENSRRRMAAILKMVLSLFLSRESYYFNDRVGSLSDHARVTSVCRIHGVEVENREAWEDKNWHRGSPRHT